jgi:DNA invertase Pin-like site-specific DNA recombinase
MSRQFGSAKFRERYEASRNPTDRRRIPPAKEAAIHALVGGGMSKRATARLMNVSPVTVSAVLARARKVTPEAA